MKNRKPAYIIRLFVVATVAVLAAVGVLQLATGGERTSYRTAKVTRGEIAEAVTANGTLNPVDLVTVGTQVSGQVSKVYVQMNDRVTKGQLLAEIDPSLLLSQVKQDQSALETARASYEQAERDMIRTRMLLEKDYVAKVDLEHAQQTYISARNAFESAKTVVERDQVNLNYAKIYAPIDGTVISQDITLGQTVQASFQTPNMFKIAGDLTHMKIDVGLSESDIGKVKPDMPVNFTTDAFPNRRFSGTVQLVNLNPDSQQGVVTYKVIVTVDNKDKLLLPGMTAYVSIVLAEKKDVLRVPSSALRFTPPPQSVSGLDRLFRIGMPSSLARLPDTSGNKHMLHLLRNGVLVALPVTTGASDDTYVEVSGEGLTEGDTVVTGIMPLSRH